MEDFLKKLHWLGHAGFRIDSSKIIYIDPFQISPGPKADLIFITHEHYDHCSPEDVNKIQGPDTKIITEKDSAKKLKGDITIVKPGDQMSFEDIKVTVLPGYNTNKDFHPKAKSWLGFLLEIEGIKVYHPGDSDFIPEMRDLSPDIALLPVSGVYVMDVEMAVKAALEIKPRLAIPMHYGAIVGDVRDAEAFKKKLEGLVEVRILKKI